MSYYSQASHIFFGGPVTRTVKILIIANVAVFLVLAFSELAGSHRSDFLFRTDSRAGDSSA